MGPALIAFTRLVGTLATGYWLNDFGTWIATTFGFGSKVVTPAGNKFQWWYVLILLVILGGLVSLVIWGIQKIVPSSRGRRRRR